MGTLFTTLNTGAGALHALDQALQISQNNVTNASTPGFAAQSPSLQSLPFQPSQGLPGGVRAGDAQSARNEYLEQAVRTQAELQGDFAAQSQALTSIEAVFSISGQSGIGSALNNLFQSFSSWSATPDSSAARRDVLAKAQDLAQSFQQVSAALGAATSGVSRQIDSTVLHINMLTAQIAAYNAKIRQGSQPDAGLDARTHDALESLSGLAGITTRIEGDGKVSIFLGGQAPLVLGDQAFQLKTGYFDSTAPVNVNAPPAAHIVDASGQDLTGTVSHGSLGGLLQVRNTVLPSLQGDGQQIGALNQLAKQVADRVNALLQSGATSAGAPGVPLFTYNPSSVANVAATLQLDAGATALGLAPVDPGPPVVSNGIALALANLGNSTYPADHIGGVTIFDFYGITAAQVGRQTSGAVRGQSAAATALAQTRAFRASISGVSLDAEAVRLIELQRGYQAVAKLIGVMDSLLQTLIDMIR